MYTSYILCFQIHQSLQMWRTCLPSWGKLPFYVVKPWRCPQHHLNGTETTEGKNTFMTLWHVWIRVKSPPLTCHLWHYFSLRPVESDNTLKIKNEKTRSLLLFTNVTEKHFGNYTCFASNRLGASNASMLLFSKCLYPQHTFLCTFQTSINLQRHKVKDK